MTDSLDDRIPRDPSEPPCLIPDCEVPVATWLFCQPHWRMIPDALRRDLQLEVGASQDPTARFRQLVEAAKAAIGARPHAE